MTEIQNPVLRGFNPDPAFLRVDDTYYLATSTFEMVPRSSDICVKGPQFLGAGGAPFESS